MSKNQSTGHLFSLRVRQLGNPSVKEGFSFDTQGDVVPDIGNNRRTRRMIKAALRKKKGEGDICGRGEA
ncbi:TPA: hypothetical protein QIS90_000986 [Providencia rettgeri]|uniref:hypothetical protein n=1 Tax=Providencia sp. PROV273 TaxID=2949960 RepID=UPI002349C0C0|nr:hypothetical protein [Providencia sp. PROV273]HEP0305179.1 hypothetical protein [Providencia rettgeri]